MPDNKKHHYVPRFYLKMFSRDQKSVNLFNIPSARKITTAALKNQCYRDYLYGKDLELEKGLAMVEAGAATIIRSIQAAESLTGLTPSDRITVVVYLLMQHARTAYAIDMRDEQTDMFMKYLLGPEMERAGFSKEQLAGVKITRTNSAQHSVINATRHYHLLLDLKWKLLKVRDSLEFITSDNPAVFYNQLFSFRRFTSTTGVAWKGLQIFLPLSPNLLLLLYDGGVYGVGDRRADVVHLTSVRDVEQINRLQFASALENVYFRNEGFPALQQFQSSEKYRRKEKAEMKIYPGEVTPEESKELVMMSSSDVRTDLDLGVVRLLKPAKEWRNSFQLEKAQPSMVVRDERLLELHEEFMRLVDAESYRPDEFFKFLKDKYPE